MSTSADGTSSDATVAVATSRTVDGETTSRPISEVLRDYLELMKPEISAVVTLSAFTGFLVGSPSGLDGWVLLWTLIGVASCAGGVGVLNHVMEWRYDARMKRTAARPLPDGRVDMLRALAVGVIMVGTAVGILCPLVNALTAVLAMMTTVLYLCVYTPLKRETKWNTLIGTIPGALPALGGYTAATGAVEPSGWAVFGILACWQMPHFLALAWMYRKDYARGDYAMLPVVEPNGDSTARQMVGFAALLLPLSLVPMLVGPIGWFYGGGVLALGCWFLATTLFFYQERTGKKARRVLKVSVVYVPALTALVFVDWLV